MRVTVSKKVSFDAAHYLPKYKGPCQRVHGHTFEVEVGLLGVVRKDGMVIDFKDLKNLLQEEVVDKYDHQDLNNFFDNPTAENIAVSIWMSLLSKEGNLGPYLEYVKVWESPDSCCEVKG